MGRAILFIAALVLIIALEERVGKRRGRTR
jgi:hypothetical protein